MLEFVNDTTFEYEDEENEDATEDVVNVENCFDKLILRVLRNDFQNP